ncbi:hypothetical protein D9613_010728 [Agrocybe pediades]|uniref:Nephrocystin 3-like N-terminal domain-containing protein n=1 Tax=Agrocybe pediades TaxID=84607 RepID=A0A8H4QLL0_9AGAR|nr:hypothetical protein D9613_010728 [Agrocybe pediades]
MTQPDVPVPSQLNLSHSIVNGGTFTQHNYIRGGVRPGYARLLENVATAALHDSVHVVDPPKCYPNTRVAIIQTATDWTLGTNNELSGKPILWMKGGAGAGKSAIARSVAERCSDEGLLLGTFFFGAADPTRNHVKSLVATLSYQISIILPEFRDMVTSFIEDDMLIFDRSIRTQFSTLIIRPLSMVLANRPAASTVTPRLVIIDGLDECSSTESQQDLLFALQEVTNTTTHIQFLICSRPESHLNSAFSLPHMVATLRNIFLDNEDYTAAEDIRVYLEGKFKQIKEGHVFNHTLPDPWPTPEMVHTLVDKSSGQFIYAATVIRYVNSPRHRPDQRLNAIFKLQPPFKDLPFTELDALYRLIISKAEDLPTVLDILAFPALYNYYPLIDIKAILELDSLYSVWVLLADLCSIVTISNGNVLFLHKSLTDFLAEPQRAGDLYQDLSRAQLSHVARMISFFSTHSVSERKDHFSNSWLQMGPFDQVLQKLENPDNMKADYVSQDIIFALLQFGTSGFFIPLLTCNYTDCQNQTSSMGSNDKNFIGSYFRYLYYIKDVSSAFFGMHGLQMTTYCKCVLSVLDKNWSSNWNAHFIYTYYHLLHDVQYHLPWKLLHANIYHDMGDMHLGTFGDTLLHLGAASLHPFSDDITKVFHDLLSWKIKKKEAIFAKSATFCLSFLCNERRASQDAGRTYGIAGHDQRKKREHPWHWRQMVPRPPSLGNQLAPITFQGHWSSDDICKLTSIRKALRNCRLNDRYKSIQVTTIHEYLQVQTPQVRNTGQAMSIKPGEQPQRWMLYMFLLELLPHILPLSERYEPLVTMCRKKCFSSRSQIWPRKSRRARQAIDTYLRRMDLQEGSK